MPIASELDVQLELVARIIVDEFGRYRSNRVVSGESAQHL